MSWAGSGRRSSHFAPPAAGLGAAAFDELLEPLEVALDLPVAAWAKEEGIADAEIKDRLIAESDRKMAQKVAIYGPELMRMAEKSLLLQILDQTWKDHLLSLDHLRQGINLRAYAQRDPLNEYKSEAFALFNAMLDELKERVTSMLARVELGPEAPPVQPRGQSEMIESHPDPSMASAAAEPAYEMAGGVAEPVRVTSTPIRSETVNPNDPTTWRSTPRNAPCTCGSGRKFKHCHGRAM